ncbi:MAG: SUMF1/EgtB/PvdO family nonheme iron enzyme, partial [Planctomycetes bacterium]|nr:SUMF1/EgtB/PvdO family nonheme iron enzyme [Planctomycetota bacterium]
MRKCFGSCTVTIAGLIMLVQTGCGGDDAPRSANTVSANKQSGRNRTVDQTDKTITNSIGMKLVRIPAGEFLMGATDTDPGGREDEKPQHRVRITQPFYMGAYEVTQGEFQAVMGLNPSFFSNEGPVKDSLKEFDCARFPVDGVTWYQAEEFCRRLSEYPAEKDAGRVYRLPFEAEWEYSCRAGTTTVFHYGNTLSSTQANFKGSYPFGDAGKGPFLSRTTTVGSYAPNAFGLYDMHGNLNEWCTDKFQRDYYRDSPTEDPKGPPKGTSRVIRGGDWYSDARDCRSAFRYADIPDGKFYALGFRVVCVSASVGTGVAPVFSDTQKPNDRSLSPTTATKLNEQPLLSAGEDWPRWRGPRADGTWLGPKLASAWPKDELQRVWRQKIGGGYGGVSVSGGRVYVMDRQQKPNEAERVLCFDAINGKPLWSRSYPVDYKDVSYPNGPRATPTIFRGHIYTLGAVGNLLCLNALNGETVWSKDLVKEFRARVPIWGLSASPVVFEDLLIVHAGAEPEGCYLAFDLNTGEERWRS